MKQSHRFLLFLLTASLLVIGLVPPISAAASSPTSSSGPRAFSAPAYGVTKPTRTIDARSLPRVHRGPISTSHTLAPSRGLLADRAGRPPGHPVGPLNGTRGTTATRSHTAPPPPAHQLSPGSSTGDRPGSTRSAVGAGNFEILNSFTGATLDNTGCCEPPDTQIAVSPTQEFEAVNLTGFVFDRGGNQLGSFDLVPFMGGGTADGGSDPQVVYDSGSGRWMLSLMVCQNASCGGSWTTMGVNLAVSSSSDPFGNWLLYENIYSGTPFNDQGNLQDQPKLGFSDDKVTLSDNVYNGHCGAGSCFKQEDVTTYQKSDLTAGVAAHYIGFTSGYAFDSIPARPTPSASGGDSTQYLVWQGFGSLGVNQITGTPNGGDVNNSNQQSPGIGGMTAVVDAAGIPAGAESDNFIGSATWAGNHLWASSTDGCNISGTIYDCTRLDEVDTSNAGSLRVLLDQNIGDAGTYELYPSVTQDCLGEVVFGITYSDNFGTLPSAQAVGSRTPGSGYSRDGYRSGDTSYTGGRWGDYSGVQEDPADCGNVWAGEEYGAVGSGGNWATALAQFSFDTPFVTSTSPGSGPATGGTTVDIFGFDFVNGGTSVSFGGASAGVSFVNSGHLQATSPSGSGGPVSISVTTANGTSTGGSFSWIPVVSGVSPRQGPTAGGQTVHLTGAGFTGASSVTFGGVAASFGVSDDGDITAFAPAHSAATVDVTVTTGTGTSATSVSDFYTYVAVPTVTHVAPNAGPTSGGTTVTVTGTGFSGVGRVLFGSVAARSFTVVSSTSLRAVSPAQAAGLHHILVSTPGGTSAVVTASTFTYQSTPTVTHVAPNAGPTSGGTTVTVTGTGFSGVSRVLFGSVAARSFTVVSSTSLRAVSPAQSASVHHILVSTPGGTSAVVTASTFTYQSTPTVTHVSPNVGPTSGGTTVTVTGTGFSGVSRVLFGSVAARSFTVVSSTSLRAVSPAQAAGVHHILVSTLGGTSAVVTASTYTYR